MQHRRALVDAGEGVVDVYVAQPDGFHLRALQGQARFVAVDDMIIAQGLAVVGDVFRHKARARRRGKLEIRNPKLEGSSKLEENSKREFGISTRGCPVT